MVYIDNEEEFILKDFCNQKNIKIKYIVLYIHEENKFVKLEWRTIMTINDLLLINCNFVSEF